MKLSSHWWIKRWCVNEAFAAHTLCVRFHLLDFTVGFRICLGGTYNDLYQICLEVPFVQVSYTYQK